MAPLNDPEILARYKCALANWHVTGYVVWKETAHEWVMANLGPMSVRDIGELMHRHVEAGGEIDQVPERRPEWNDRPFHYDLRLSIGGRLRYIETILVDDDPGDPMLKVVSIHDA